MSLFATAVGTLVQDPLTRTGSNGRSYVLATLRLPGQDSQSILARLIIFDARVAETVLAHAKGDVIAVCGQASLRSWDGPDGQLKHGIGITVDSVMSAFEFATRRKRAAAPAGD